MNVSPNVLEVFKKAQFTRKNAYAIYSGVKVGAAIKLKNDDTIYYGANVEYVVNGVSVCAERSALSHCVSNVGKPDIEFVVVCSNTIPALYPCGVCLQALSEFAGPDLEIYISNKDEIIEKITLGQLMPNQYASLPKVLDE